MEAAFPLMTANDIFGGGSYPRDHLQDLMRRFKASMNFAVEGP